MSERYIILKDYYELYDWHARGIKEANNIKDWDKADKSYIINKYVEVEGDPVLSDSYLSAIICCFWTRLGGFKLKSQNSVNDPELYYSWLIGGIMRALKDKAWLNPENEDIYADPKGAERAVNQCITTERLRWYQSQNFKKRNGDAVKVSFDQLEDDYGEAFLNREEFVDADAELYSFKMDAQDLVQTSCKRNDFMTGFVVDAILNYNMFDTIKEQDKKYSVFNKTKLYKHIWNLNKNEAITKEFSKTFKIPYSATKREANKIGIMSRRILHREVDYSLEKLKAVYDR